MRFSRSNSLLLSLVFCISGTVCQSLPVIAEDAPAPAPGKATEPAPAQPAPSTPAAAPASTNNTDQTAGEDDTENADDQNSKKHKKDPHEEKFKSHRAEAGSAYYDSMRRQSTLDAQDKEEYARHRDQGGGYYGKIRKYKAPPEEVKPVYVPPPPPPPAAPLHHDPNERKFDDDPGKAGSITFTRHASQAKELLSTGHYDLAKKHYKEAFHLKPDANELLAGYWETCEKTSDWSESVRTLEQMFKADPATEKEYCWAHGEALYELRKWDQAVPTLKKAVSFGKNVDQCHQWLLKIALQQKNNAAAADEYTALLKIHPDYKMQIDFANMLETEGKHDAALSHYKAAAAMQPDGAVLSRIGYMMMSYNKDWNGAISFYNKAMQADPRNAQIYQQSIEYCKSKLAPPPKK